MEPDVTPANEPKSQLGRLIASWMLCVFQLVFAILHVHPPFAYRVGATSTTYVIGYINSLGPYWVVLFSLSGIFLTAALIRKNRWCWVGHLTCGSIFAGYTAALFAGAFFDTPHGPFTYPAMSLVITIGHALLTYSYGGDR